MDFENSYGGNIYWIHAIEEFSKCTWIYILHDKSDLSDNMVKLVQHIRNNRIKITHMCCDGAGQNYAFQSDSEHLHIVLDFEFMPISTPQHNGVIEHSFHTLHNNILAMLIVVVCMGLYENDFGTNVIAPIHY